MSNGADRDQIPTTLSVRHLPISWCVGYIVWSCLTTMRDWLSQIARRQPVACWALRFLRRDIQSSPVTSSAQAPQNPKLQVVSIPRYLPVDGQETQLSAQSTAQTPRQPRDPWPIDRSGHYLGQRSQYPGGLLYSLATSSSRSRTVPPRWYSRLFLILQHPIRTIWYLSRGDQGRMDGLLYRHGVLWDTGWMGDA